MRVSAKAEYACIAMLELAAKYEESHLARVKSIADAHGIPQRFLVQILLQLKGLGLVTSVRGAAGGYQLAKAPDRIALADIINAIDPPRQNRPAPLASPYSPAVQAVRGIWTEVQAEEQRILEETTLADLLRRSEQTSVSAYQI